MGTEGNDTAAIKKRLLRNRRKVVPVPTDRDRKLVDRLLLPSRKAIDG
jgi:hypothetical protein